MYIKTEEEVILLLHHYNPITAADNLILSIDNIVMDLYISAPPARDQLMVLLDKLSITHAVEVKYWNSFRPGSFRSSSLFVSKMVTVFGWGLSSMDASQSGGVFVWTSTQTR